MYKEVLAVNEAGSGAGGETQNAANPVEKKKLTGKERAIELGGRLIGFISATVTPMIPGLVAGGMLKTILLLITLAWPAFKEMQTYTLLSMVANVPFYFMPVFVAYEAAKKLGGTPIFVMIATAGLVYPDFVTLLAGEDVATIFGIVVTPVKYSSTLLPALLIAVCAYYVEVFW